MGRDPVKSTADFWRRGTLLCAGAGLAFASIAQAQTGQSQAPILLGGAQAPRKSPILLDPVLPHGQIRKLQVRRLSGSLSHADRPLRCDTQRPVCVAGEAEQVVAEGALSHLVRAYEEHTYGASLPAPVDAGSGPLVWTLLPQQSLRVERELDTSLSRGFDRGRAACWGGAPSLESARRCISEASVYRFAPATASWLVAGASTAVAEAMGDAPESRQVIDESFAYPGLGVLTSSDSYQAWDKSESRAVSSRRSARFFRYLAARSAAPLGHAEFAALTLAATHTPAGAVRFESEPDIVDVLSSSVQYDSSALARLFDDFAAFSFFDARSLGQRIEPDWLLAGKTLPRSIAYAQTMQPTGSLYLRVDLTPEQREQTIAFKIACEAPVSYVWSVVRLLAEDARGPAVLAGYQERGTQTEMRAEPIPGTMSLLLIGTNMGGIDMAHPFDPDHEPHEAHGCRGYVSPI